MLCLFRVSQCSLGPSPCRGLQVCLLHQGSLLLWSGGLLLRSGGLLLRLLQSGGLLLHRGGLLLRSGGLLLRRGGLLLRSGGLPLHLFQSVGLQLRRGGHLPCLLCPGGLQSRRLLPGGSSPICSILASCSASLPSVPATLLPRGSGSHSLGGGLCHESGL